MRDWIRLHILAHEGAVDDSYTHNQTSIYVGDPGLQIVSEAERRQPVYLATPRTGSRHAGDGAVACNPGDSTLVAYGLTAAQEQGFAGRDGRLAAFWSEIDDSACPSGTCSAKS